MTDSPPEPGQTAPRHPSPDDVTGRILARLEEFSARLDALAERFAATDRLREQLDHERRARRELAEQVEWLADRLGRAEDRARRLAESPSDGRQHSD